MAQSTARARVVEQLEKLIEELNRPIGRDDRRRGWESETRQAVIEDLRSVKDRLADPRWLHPRETADPLGVFRGLDAMGIAIGDPLAQRIVDSASEVRKLASEEKRAKA